MKKEPLPKIYFLSLNLKKFFSPPKLLKMFHFPPLNFKKKKISSINYLKKSKFSIFILVSKLLKITFYKF